MCSMLNYPEVQLKYFNAWNLEILGPTVLISFLAVKEEGRREGFILTRLQGDLHQQFSSTSLQILPDQYAGGAGVLEEGRGAGDAGTSPASKRAVRLWHPPSLHGPKPTSHSVPCFRQTWNNFISTPVGGGIKLNLQFCLWKFTFFHLPEASKSWPLNAERGLSQDMGLGLALQVTTRDELSEDAVPLCWKILESCNT